MSLAPFSHRGGHTVFGRMMDDLSNKALGPFHTFVPTFDVRETKEGYQLEGELPGVKRKDIEIEYSNPNTLNITGHTERSSEEKDDSWWISERSTGNFRRSFTFPSSIDQDAITANLKDGVLAITVPKTSKKTDVTRIEVE